MKILIAVPTFETIYPDTFKSIYDLDKCGNETVFEFIRGYDCAAARNKIVKKAQEIKADYILSVDNDMVLPKETLSYLLEDLKDVCFGWCYRRSNGFNGYTSVFPLSAQNYSTAYTADEIVDLKDKGYKKVKIRGAGFACAFVKTSLFASLDYPYFSWVNYKDGQMLSEDLYFCTQLRKANIPVFLDTRLRCGHIFREIK